MVSHIPFFFVLCIMMQQAFCTKIFYMTYRYFTQLAVPVASSKMYVQMQIGEKDI